MQFKSNAQAGARLALSSFSLHMLHFTRYEPSDESAISLQSIAFDAASVVFLPCDVDHALNATDEGVLEGRDQVYPLVAYQMSLHALSVVILVACAK